MFFIKKSVSSKILQKQVVFFSQDQKIPKPKRLQEWYKKMLDKGIIERIVLDYKDIYKQALEDNLQSAAELPYFEGDFWPNVMEENIREQDQVNNFYNFTKQVSQTIFSMFTKQVLRCELLLFTTLCLLL